VFFWVVIARAVSAGLDVGVWSVIGGEYSAPIFADEFANFSSASSWGGGSFASLAVGEASKVR
jgi:hypothetical protein